MKLQIYILLCLPLLASAQNQRKVDSLFNELERVQTDTIKIKVLVSLFWEHYYTHPEKAKAFASQIMKQSQKINHTRGLWEAHNMLGVLEFMAGNYDGAIEWFRKGLRLSDSNKYIQKRKFALTYLGHSYRQKAKFVKADSCFSILLKNAEARQDKLGMAIGHKALAVNYFSQEHWLPALQHYFKADSLLGDVVSIDKAEVLQNIGITYHSLDNFIAEQFYYSRALEVYKKMNDDYGINEIKISLASAHINNKKFAEAETLLSQALTYFSTINSPQTIGEIKYLLGRTNYALKKHTKAEKYFLDAINHLEKTDGNHTLNHSYRGLGDLYTSQREYRMAIQAYDKAYEQAKKVGSLTDITDILLVKADLYFHLKDFKTAYEIQQKHRVLADSLNDVKSKKVLYEIEAKYQNEKAFREIELLTTKNKLAQKQKKDLAVIYSTVIIGTLVVCGVLYLLFISKIKTNRKLRQLDTLRTHFFSNISHEFRTPLTLIAGPIQERLKRETLTESERAEFEMVVQNSNHLMTLVDQLLELSRIEAGGVDLKIQQGDLATFVKNITESFSYLAKTKDISYQTDIRNLDGTAWFDRNALQKILNNLIINAFKYTPNQGTIILKADVVDNQLHFSVTNTGPGISEDNISKIFDRFYQINPSAGGIGVGLSLVKELVSLHRGTITARSKQGEHTSFEIRLPIFKDAFETAFLINEPVQLNEFAPHLEVSTSPLNDKEVPPQILIVEDNADIRAFVKSILSPLYNFIEAPQGSIGLTLALEHIPDLIISDVMMPDKDGITLCRELKNDERTSHIPIILLTAKAGEENTLRAFETGADDYITKPFNSDLLKVRVQKLIELRKKLHERFSQEMVLKPKEIVINSTDALFLQKVQEIIDKDLADSNFNSERFAIQIGMSRMQLHRKLTGLLGISANKFIRTNRLKMAADLLSKSDVNISEIGYKVGFADPSYFSKCFREQYHCTPSEFATRKVIQT